MIPSGFAEIGETALQQDMVEIARKHNIRIMGPNIYGFYYTPQNLCATFCTPYDYKGAAALSSQSGGVGMAIIGFSRTAKMGVSAIVGLGNKSDLDEDDLLTFFEQDDNTQVIAMHVEDLKDGRTFAEVASRVHAAGGWLHSDVVQAPGRIAVNVATLEADTVALSAHKIGGPAGAGALVAPNLGVLSPVQTGGGQEQNLRAGTENVPGIAGFGRAANLAAAELAEAEQLAALRDNLERRLLATFSDARVFGREARRLPNTSCLALPGLAAETQVIALDLSGIAVSAGAACSSGKVRSSHVLRAMGVGENDAGSAIRVSLGWATTVDEVDRFAAVWSKLAARRSISAAAAAAL